MTGNNGRDAAHPDAPGPGLGEQAIRKVGLGLKQLGPGLITGAADDDPSGIATYSQAGAQYGFNMLWTLFFTYPLMVAVQVISARIGRVTGKGLAANLLQVLPRWAVVALALLLFIANTINIGADIAAMGAAAELIAGGGAAAFTVAAAAISLLLQIFVPYHRYVLYLKWSTLVLFAYVGVVFSVRIDWGDVATHVVMPTMEWSPAWMTVIVAVFGTTISPYLFFWQTAEEVEDMEMNHQRDLRHSNGQEARRELRRMAVDTVTGMGLSNAIAFFIMLTTAVTLHRSGITDIETSAEAAEALRPIAGEFAFLLFSLGIVGTGFLAVPVLAGSAGYALAEAFGLPKGLEKKPGEAKAFYGVIVAAMVVAVASIWMPLDPIKMLFWTAVINGVVAIPILAAMMLLARNHHQMGRYVANRWQTTLGWAATAVMSLTVVGMFVL
ncbi:MAG: divalent metal cation transporter [Sphingomonadales bacterium]|nr:divalent metal cation transporter [Sphingomonadales bacterium]